MRKLSLLFTKDGLQYRISKNKSVLEESVFFVSGEAPGDFIEQKLDEIFSQKDFDEISVISALNHFTLMPADFSRHELGFDLISYNSEINREHEELMLAVNKKFGVQFYFSLPKKYYLTIKSLNKPTRFNFSGEQFLNNLTAKNQKEIHINLYHNQCEFFALEQKKVILYNNLDVNSEVDFLYFVMFTLSKIGFGTDETNFFVYGETTENETFISELQKFVNHLKIVFDNIPKKNFIFT